MTVASDPGAERLRLGAAVRGLRLARGLSQQEMADAMGIHRVTFVRFEQGQQDLGLSHLRALVEALGDDGERVLRDLLTWQAEA